MRPEGPEPILPALDVARTRAFYELLGFTAVVHLERNNDLVPERNTFSCYWRVADADRLFRGIRCAWSALRGPAADAGASG